MTDLAVAALARKRAELAGEIRLAEERLDQLRADVLHLDAAIRIIDPGYHVDAIVPRVRRQRREWFGNGELLRMVLETLRKAPEPLTAREVAVALMERRGFDATDAATVRLVEKRVDATVRRREGLVERVVYGPRSVGWKVATADRGTGS
jgi:hypothetical protein